MTNRKKSMSWREISVRWKTQPTKKAAQKWLDQQMESGAISLEVIKKLASNGDGPRTVDPDDPDYNEELVDYAKEKVAALRSQSYGERGRTPPEDGEVRLYKTIRRQGAEEYVRVPLHGIKNRKKTPKGPAVPVRFNLKQERIVVGG